MSNFYGEHFVGEEVYLKGKITHKITNEEGTTFYVEGKLNNDRNFIASSVTAENLYNDICHCLLIEAGDDDEVCSTCANSYFKEIPFLSGAVRFCKFAKTSVRENERCEFWKGKKNDNISI